MQFEAHSSDAEQQMHGQLQGHQYVPNDSMLFQHYADMEMARHGGGLRNLLPADTHVTPTATFDMDRGLGGEACSHPRWGGLWHCLLACVLHIYSGCQCPVYNGACKQGEHKPKHGLSPPQKLMV